MDAHLLTYPFLPPPFLTDRDPGRVSAKLFNGQEPYRSPSTSETGRRLVLLVTPQRTYSAEGDVFQTDPDEVRWDQDTPVPSVRPPISEKESRGLSLDHGRSLSFRFLFPREQHIPSRTLTYPSPLIPHLYPVCKEKEK